jgi:hypothetical protein
MATFFKFSNPFTVFLLMAVGFVLFRRRLYRELPWFTTYIFYIAVYTCVFYWVSTIRPRMPLAFYCYWGGNIINQFIAFMVIIEVFRNLVREHKSVRKFGITALIVIGALVLLVAILMAPYGSQVQKNTIISQMAHAMLVLQRSIRIVQIGLLVAIFAFGSYLALSWRNYNFGIALGYGLYASVNLVSSVVSEYLGVHRLGTTVANTVNLLDGLAYKLTLILWMTYLWRADRGQPTQLPPSGGDKDLQDWGDALKPLAK